MNRLFLPLTSAALVLLSPTSWAQAPAAAKMVETSDILAAGDRIAQAQVPVIPVRRGKLPVDWVAGTMYVGFAAYSHVSQDPVPGDAVAAMGKSSSWTPNISTANPFHADNECVGQTILDAYDKTKDPAIIAPLKANLDALCDHLTAPEADTAKPTWWWCDALFMAPPVMAQMSAETGDHKYIDAMDKEYWRTAGLLYDTDEHLFFRDATFLHKLDPNGKKIFWSRGNGWVMAGLARVLTYMPKDYPDRARYVTLFKDMATRISTLQGADGLWRASLLDSEILPGPETSGTAFFTYAFAWGVDNGILDRATYEPIIAKGWAGMMAARRPDGLPSYVQPGGGAPALARPEATQLYATGGYLLTAAELTRFAPFPAVRAPRLKAPPMPARKFPPPAEPVADAKAFVRWVPERMDDIAWENDRIGHRIFGPALAVHPGDGPESGIDVWVKSTRAMVINKFYANGDYHHDHGEGMDCYETGHSRGDGGWGVWDAGKLWNSLDWVTYKILQNGPDVAKFQITYAPWDANGRKVWESRIESLEAGSNLDRIETTIGSDKPDDMVIGIGIARRKGKDHLTQDKDKGILAYWEPETKNDGTIGCGVLVDPSLIVGFAQTKDDNIVLVKVTPGKPLVYYTGACWTKGLDFHSEDEWLAYLKGFTRN